MMVYKWRMKRKTVSGIMLTLLLIGMLALAFNIQPIKAESKTIYVDDDNITGPWDGTPEHPYQNITNALEHALAGDTIRVRSGIYHERVVVNKENVSIIGDSRETTFVSGDGIGAVVRVTANNVTITEFTIRDSGTSSPDLDSGIWVSSGGNRFERNIITNNTNSIYLSSSSSNFILGNTITNSTYGIRLVYASYNTLTDNTMKYNLRGIYSYYSDHNVIYHNSFINNTVKQVDYAYSGYVDTWDDGYPSGGNYWSNYTGGDVKKGPNQDLPGSDGRGDTPHVINANNTDNYPLMPVVHNDNTGLDYSRIQEAIDSNKTQDGHTIRVDNVTSYEHVTVRKRALTLIGQGMNKTIIDGSGTGTALKIVADNVTVTGFTIQNTEYGIDVYSSGNNITGNIIRGNTYGVKLSSSPYNWLRDNNITGNRYNFYVEGSILPHFKNDIDTSNTVDEKPIYYWINKTYMTVPTNAGFVALVNSTAITVQNLTLTKNGQGLLLAFTNASTITSINTSNNVYGIKLVSSSNNTIDDSNILNNDVGVSILGGSFNNTVKGNNIINIRSMGIYVRQSFSNTIKYNNLIGYAMYGVYMFFSFNNTVEGNNITNYAISMNLWQSNTTIIRYNKIINNIEAGINFLSSSNNMIYGNNITNNRNGIVLQEGASYNIIKRNNITNNGAGIYVYQSSLNSIFHNNFFNSPYAELGTWDNTWDDDYPSGGNYWSGYIYKDTMRGENQALIGSDGINDTAYILSTVDRDSYPLVKPYSGEHDIVIREVTLYEIIGSDFFPATIFEKDSHNLTIMAKVVNYGTNSTYRENFTIYVYNKTDLIGSINVTLSGRDYKIIAFSMNTAGLNYSIYPITVNVTQVPGEWNITDNTWTTNFTVTGKGDVNGDSVVDGQDIVLVIEHIPSYPGHPKWELIYDLNDDGVVDGQDAVICIELIPKSYP